MLRQISYIDLEIIKILHDELYQFCLSREEPIDPFEQNIFDVGKLEGNLFVPQTQSFGQALYPTIETKAGILFYIIIKNHVFHNGNKRMAVFCLETFLNMNGYQLLASRKELFDKAIETVNSDPKEFDRVKKDLAEWVRTNIK